MNWKEDQPSRQYPAFGLVTCSAKQFLCTKLQVATGFHKKVNFSVLNTE